MLVSKKSNLTSLRSGKTLLTTVAVGAVMASSIGVGVTNPQPAAAAAPGAACTITIKPGTEVSDAVNGQSDGATICLTAGVFSVQETIAPKHNQTLRGTAGTVLDGSASVGGWVQNDNRWQLKGQLPAKYSGNGVCEDLTANNCNQAEDLYVDGKPLIRAATLAAVDASSYYADYDSNTITVGLNPSSRDVKMAKTRTAIMSRASGVRIEGVTVTRFANLSQQGALVVSGPNWTVTDSTITDNHAIGLMMTQGPSATIKNNSIVDNGQLGIGQHRSNNAVIEGNTIADNNTKGYWIADWESGGIKITFSSSMVRNNTVKDNLGVGVWADVEADGVTIDNNQITGNAADGVRYEISRNGVITNNTVTSNGLGMKRGGGTGLMSGSGIDVNTSAGVKIAHNAVSGNLNGIGLQARARGTGPWGEWALANVSVTGNTVDLTGNSPSTAVSGIVQAGDRIFNTAKAGISFEDNHYIVKDTSKKQFNLGRSAVAFDGWQNAGHDTTGTMRLAIGKPAPAPAPVPAPVPTPTPAPLPGGTARVVASDAFSSTVEKGLGTAAVGGDWSILGSKPLYSVSGGAAHFTMAAPGHLPGARLAGVEAKNSDTTVSFTLDNAPTGSGVYTSLVGRSVPDGGDYRAKVQQFPKGVALSLVRTDATGVETILAEDVFISDEAVTAGSVVNLRLSVSGQGTTTVQAKAWLGANVQPSDWQTTAADTTENLQKPGSIGILTSLSGSSVNAPIQLSVFQLDSQEAF